MSSIGIICEYNPFHNGHLYHIKETKKMFPNSPIILIMSGNFTQRGIPSIINKWEKTKLALQYGVDLVVELPYVFASQSADIFAKGSIQLLKELKITDIVFGSETSTAKELINLSNIQLNNIEYNKTVKKYLDNGINYPTAMSRALKDISNITITTPNDLLGLSYTKEIITQQANINIHPIKRTVGYHDINITNNYASASLIREKLQNNEVVNNLMPYHSNNIIKNNNLHFINDYFQLLKFKILSDNHIEKYQTVDEGIENRIYKNILKSKNIEELIEKIKTKRYTYNKIQRMLTHILCGFTKEEGSNINNEYIRILGFSSNGKKYLNKIKKELTLPIIFNYKDNISKILDIEFRTTCIYASILNEKDKITLIEKEIKDKPFQL